MTTQATFRKPSRGDNDQPVGVGPRSTVLGAVNLLAAERGDEPPFRSPETFPWGDDPGSTAEVYPEAWIITELAADSANDRVRIVAMSDRVNELLQLAHTETTGASLQAAAPESGPQRSARSIWRR